LFFVAALQLFGNFLLFFLRRFRADFFSCRLFPRFPEVET